VLVMGIRWAARVRSFLVWRSGSAVSGVPMRAGSLRRMRVAGIPVLVAAHGYLTGYRRMKLTDPEATG
jgi:hypothetical protein